MKHEFERYCKNYQDIENYEAAKKDDFIGWHCHHRLETHTSDGERRLVDISYKELKALGMYYKRPAEELIFLPRSEHEAFKKGKTPWNKGKKCSEETKKKLREANKGENNPFYGKRHSEETKKKLSESHKGKNTWSKGMRFFNNGKLNIRAKECPPGFTTGRLRK